MRRSMWAVFAVLITIGPVLTLSGCAGLMETEPAPPQTTTVSYNMPSMVNAEPDKQLQKKSGLMMSATPNTFNAEKKTNAKYREASSFLVDISDGKYPYEKKLIPYYEIVPKNISFKVKVTNQMTHILKLAGAVVTLNVGGKMINLDKSAYQSFLDGIILPSQEAEFNILGPSIETLTSPSTIGLTIYDIVTQTDAAGNATERATFEWYFQYKTEQMSKQEPITIEKVRMTREEGKSVGATYQW